MDNPLDKYFEKKNREKEQWDKENPEHRPTKMRVIVKMVVGAYLLYLTYSVYKDGGLNRTGFEKILIIVAMVVFVVASIYFLIDGVKALRAGNYYDPNSPYSEDPEYIAAHPEYFDEVTVERAKTDADAYRKELEAEKAREEAAANNRSGSTKSLAELAKLSDEAQIPEDEQ